jgi:CheY-like chemotaxis protein/signal transduction histidine kinase
MLDISEEIKLTEEVADLTAAVKKGNLTVRGDVTKFEGNARQIVQRINDGLDAVIKPLNITTEYVDRIAKGSIPRKIIDEYKGDFNEIKKSLNGLIDNLQELTNTAHAIANGDMSVQFNNDAEEDSLIVLFQPMIGVIGQLFEEIHTLTRAIAEGTLDTRGKTNKFQGEFAKIVRGVNTMLDAVIKPLNITAEYVERIASGNMPGKITDEYKGDFNEIKDNLNRCVDIINDLVTETIKLTEAAAEGQLDIRGDADKFQGDFAKIVGGINATLDAVIGPLNVAAEYVDQIASGNIPGKIIDEYKGDFNTIKNSLNGLIDSFQELTDVANAIANGDMSVNMGERSEGDILAGAFQRISRTIGRIIREIDMLGEAIIAGQLDIRGNATRFSGDFATIIQGVNATLDAVASPLHIAAEYVDRIANGNIPAKITDEYRGGFNAFKNNINCCIDAVNGLIDEAANMAEATAQGDLDRRVNAAKYKGDWGEIAKGLNKTVENIITPMRDIGGALERMAAGDLKARVTNEYQGDYNMLKIPCNELGIQLQEVQKVLENLTTAAINGQLEVRGGTHQFKGEIARMVRGFNEALDAVIKPLNLMTECVDCLAKGNIPEKITEEFKGKFNEFKENLNVLIDTTHEVTTITQKIANGNLNVTIEKRSAEDEPMIAMEQMVTYLQDVANVAEKISNKDVNVTVVPKSEEDVLNHSLHRMAANMQAMMDEIEKSMADVQQQNWLRTGQVELSDTLHAEQNFSTMAKSIITFLAKYVKAQVGALYLTNNANGDTTLQLVSSYAYTKRKSDRSEFNLGEGLVGQAALEKESILYTDVPEDYIAINLGLSETSPRQVLVTPFICEGEVKGVIELGTAQEFTKNHQDFLDLACESIAIAFNSMQTRLKMQELLEATQQQAEELHAQREQLRVSNEELELQTRALRESERRLYQQQEELRQANEELSQQIEELEKQRGAIQKRNLTLEKAQRLIEEKVKALELSSQYQSEFLSNIAHELRAPLNSLLVLFNLLGENKGGSLIEKQLEFAHTINETGTELLSLVKEVLDLSKAELRIEEMSLRGLSDYIEQNFTDEANEKGLQLKIELAKELPVSIRIDRQKVEQIVKNLLSNAFKFTEQGSVSIRITRPAAETDFSYSGLTSRHAIAISISDTGIGIPAEKQRVILKALQADGITSRKQSGMGVGLSISRELAKLIDGEIQLESEEDRGSTFTLYLPENRKGSESRKPPEHRKSTERPRPGNRFSEGRSLTGNVRKADRSSKTEPGRSNVEGPSQSKIERSVQSKVNKSVQSKEKKPVQGKIEGNKLEGMKRRLDDRVDTTPESKSILIIEDDPKFAKSLCDLAQEKGFKGLIAGDGAAGLQLAYQYIPSAIILNIGLLDINGWRVMEKLKANPETQHIPVHFISTQDISLDAMKMGAVDYLTAPVTSAEALNKAFKKLEESMGNTIKNLLIAESDEPTQMGMVELLSDGDVEITTVAKGKEAHQLLQTHVFDCMVLDLELTDISGFELLNTIKDDAMIAPLPIIVYTGKKLTKEEQNLLKKHAKRTIVKKGKSQDRLLDEVSSFLRQIESELSPDQQKKFQASYDKDAVLNGKTILLVDGDMRNSTVLTDMFEKKGLHVLFAENGKDALKQLDAKSNIDLVLMDIMMPGMNGYEATQEIRKQLQFKKLPIITLSAKEVQEERQKCLEAGANDYLSRPIDPDKLLSLLRVWLY